MTYRKIKKILFLLAIMLATVVANGQQKKYSIDEHPPKERRHLISFRRLFHPDKAGKAARKAKRKDDKKKKKHLKEYKKARKKYWKHYNKDKEYVQEGGDKVYKRMKKHKRKAERAMHHKKEPWYKRIFKKKQKRVRVKKDN